MRANFEQKAMRALGLQDKDVETCVKGKWSNLLDRVPNNLSC